MTDILDTIDGALDDYMSPDAMRWSPEPEVAEREWPKLRNCRSVVVTITVDVEPFRQAMLRAAEIMAEALAVWQRLIPPPPPSELTSETLRLLAEAPRDATIATTVETSCSAEPVAIVVQAPEVTMPESPKMRAAVERWGDAEGRRC